MDAADVDFVTVEDTAFRQAPHGGDVPREHDGARGGGTPVGDVGARGRDVLERHLDARRQPQAVQLLLPGRAGQFIVHDDDPVRVQVRAPADGHLSVDQSLVHAKQNDWHA